MDSPSPRPFGLVVWKALKRCSRAAGANPGPESRTATSTSSNSFLPFARDPSPSSCPANDHELMKGQKQTLLDTLANLDDHRFEDG